MSVVGPFGQEGVKTVNMFEMFEYVFEMSMA